VLEELGAANMFPMKKLQITVLVIKRIKYKKKGEYMQVLLYTGKWRGTSNESKDSEHQI
jgi:hypothetical protein